MYTSHAIFTYSSMILPFIGKKKNTKNIIDNVLIYRIFSKPQICYRKITELLLRGEIKIFSFS